MRYGERDDGTPRSATLCCSVKRDSKIAARVLRYLLSAIRGRRPAIGPAHFEKEIPLLWNGVAIWTLTPWAWDMRNARAESQEASPTVTTIRST